MLVKNNKHCSKIQITSKFGSLFCQQQIGKMIEIRQKKQLLRNKIRKEQLQNHFNNLRKKYFHGNGWNHELTDSKNLQALEQLLVKSQQFNTLATEIREKNLFSEIDWLVQEAVQKQDKVQAKYLLTIITNIFKDDINPYEKQHLFHISTKLFHSLHLHPTDLTSKQHRHSYPLTLTTLTPDLLLYYLSTIIYQSQFLQQRDQQVIQQIHYPALFYLVFYALKNNGKMIRIVQKEQFCLDFERAVLGVFDLKQCEYEMGNRYKATRCERVFTDVIMSHYSSISSNSQPSSSHTLPLSIQTTLFFLYDKLTQYYQQIPHLFHMKQLWLILQQSFYSQLTNEQSKQIVHIYSIMRTMVDNGCFVSELEQMLLEVGSGGGEGDLVVFEIVMQRLVYSGSVGRRIHVLEFVEGVVIAYQQNNHFAQVVQFYGLKLFQILTNIFLDADRQSLSDNKQRRILTKTLQLIYVLIQKQNSFIKTKPNQYTLYFERAQGTRKFIQIQQWAQAHDLRDNTDLTDILDLIDWLSNQFEFTNQMDDEEIDI